MGGVLSYPKSMDILNDININDGKKYIKMEIINNGNNNGIYYIYHRSITNMMSNSFKQSFTNESLAFDMLGLGNLNNFNKTNTGHFYVSYDPVDAKTITPIQTTADATDLKMYIKTFTWEHGIHLDTEDKNGNITQNAIFSIIDVPPSVKLNFGKSKSKNKSLKQLKSDLKKILKKF